MIGQALCFRRPSAGLWGKFGVAPSDRIAIFTNNDSGYLTAIAAACANIRSAALIDTRSEQCAIHAREVQSSGARVSQWMSREKSG